MNLKFIDLFAGIGGIRLGFQELGQCVFSSEWDKFAQITYEANFGYKPQGDITKIHESEIPSFDIYLQGFLVNRFQMQDLKKALKTQEGLCFLILQE
jgi:DNA (cytosine-5)-methyltransferase 1